MEWIDVLIGLFLMNAMGHFILGITKTRFLSMFGYSAKGNLAYALSLVFLALSLLIYQDGIVFLKSNGYALGALFVFMVYALFGNILVNLFKSEKGE